MVVSFLSHMRVSHSHAVPFNKFYGSCLGCCSLSWVSWNFPFWCFTPVLGSSGFRPVSWVHHSPVSQSPAISHRIQIWKNSRKTQTHLPHGEFWDTWGPFLLVPCGAIVPHSITCFVIFVQDLCIRNGHLDSAMWRQQFGALVWAEQVHWMVTMGDELVAAVKV